MAKQVDPKPRSIDPQNRVVLPPEVMRALSVTNGDYVTFEINGGDVRIQKVRWVVDRK